MKFAKRQTLFYTPASYDGAATIRARVLTCHLDGSYTIKALFYVRPDGTDRVGYLGITYRRVPADKLRASYA